jgi:dTDP-4-amino-4,6-dideoxygalactose transaminase
VEIPFFSLQAVQDRVSTTLIPRISSVIERRDFILGADVGNFENEYASFSQTKFCVGVGNGLDALKISLRCLDIGRNDEVILPANTYIATVLAVLETGAIPVLVDPDKRTYNITAAGIEPFITSNTKAVLPVHLYGHACNMESIEKLAVHHKLYIIEDNAQAQGSSFNNRLTGSIGHINATSFYPSKNLGAMGDAGAITTNNAELAQKAQLLRNVGSREKYRHELVGYNSRLDTLQAAVLSCKLPYLNEWNTERKAIAARYTSNLKVCSSVVLPITAVGADHIYHLFVIRHKKRDELQQYLLQHQIQTLIHYPVPPHLQPALAHLGYKQGSFQVTEEISETCLSLPLFIGMTHDQIDFVSEKIISFEKEFSA